MSVAGTGDGVGLSSGWRGSGLLGEAAPSASPSTTPRPLPPYPYPYPFPALCRSGAAAFHCRPAKAAELGRGRYPRLCWDGHGRLPRRHEYRGNGRGREIDSSDFILARAGGAVAT